MLKNKAEYMAKYKETHCLLFLECEIFSVKVSIYIRLMVGFYEEPMKLFLFLENDYCEPKLSNVHRVYVME